jgi:hypothetical protein
MGFKKRFIDDHSIMVAARTNFNYFNSYMINADAYILEGSYSPWFWDLYDKEEKSRESIWELLNSDFQNKIPIVKEIANLWKSISSKNISDIAVHEDSLNVLYLDCSDCPKEKIESIVYIIKNKNGKASI